MATAALPAKKKPLLIKRTAPVNRDEITLGWLTKAALFSVVFHVCLFALLMLIGSPGQANQPTEADIQDETNVQAQANKQKDPDPLSLVTDVNPNPEEPNLDIAYKSKRQEKVSVPGPDDLLQKPGIDNAPKEAPPISLPLPPGFGRGQGGPVAADPKAGVDLPGLPGGYRMDAARLAGTFFGRSGSTKDFLLREGGGTTESEAAVARGLLWLVRQQAPDGHFPLDGNFPNKGTNNDIAGTALGLLPLLGAGYTHERPKDHPFTRNIASGLNYLISKQEASTGGYGDSRFTDPRTGRRLINMYAHGLATIVMCEAYGLTQDPRFGRSAERAIRFIERAQHPEGGWRYKPRQAGDVSVFGWQVMALKSAQMANIGVSEKTMRQAQRFLDAMATEDDGYQYVAGSGSSPSMSAVGLLCRQYIQAWGPSNPRLIRGIDVHLKANPPGTLKDIYYYYYATQVMHHYGVREAWAAWNTKMRDSLVQSQDKSDRMSVNGSWAPEDGDRWARVGGRMMVTSMALLTLEVYYRYLPLYYQPAQSIPSN
jgi:hypothetical protein